MILSKAHNFFSKPKITEEEKIEIASECKKFTQVFPLFFPEAKITRKMHIFSFTLPEIILKQGKRNGCYLFLKVEQGGENATKYGIY